MPVRRPRSPTPRPATRTLESRLHAELGITPEDVEQWGPGWEEGRAWVERSYWITERRLIHLPDARRLVRIGNVVRDLWGRLADGEDIGDRLDTLYEAATGRTDATDASLELMLAIHIAARSYNAARSDTLSVRLVHSQIERDYPVEAKRLRGHDRLIVEAVRAWRRGRGRQRRGLPRKWGAVAAVLKAAGYTDRDGEQLDERRLEQRWRRRKK